MTPCQKCLEELRDIIANGAIVLELEAKRLKEFLERKEKEIYGRHNKRPK